MAPASTSGDAATDYGNVPAGQGREASPLESRSAFLEDLTWELVISLNRAACAIRGGQHGLNHETHGACAVDWELKRAQRDTLNATLEFLKACERRSPFLFFNGATFGEVAREVATKVFAPFPLTRRRHLIAAVTDYVAGTMERGAMVEIVNGLATAQLYAAGERVKTLRSLTTGTVLSVMPDGRVKWRPDDSEAEMFSLPETLLRHEPG